jgi:hypothetical protein
MFPQIPLMFMQASLWKRSEREDTEDGAVAGNA